MGIVDSIRDPRLEMPQQALWTYRQAAYAMGVCEKTIYNLKRSGQLPSVNFGGAVRFRPADVTRYIDSLVTERDTQSSESILKG